MLFFQELQKLLLQQRDGDQAGAPPASSSHSSSSRSSAFADWLENPLVAQELERWWTNASSSLLLHGSAPPKQVVAMIPPKEHYAQLYQQLVHGLQTLFGTNTVVPHEKLAKVAELDYECDTKTWKNSQDDAHTFKTSILALALAAATPLPESAQSVATLLHDFYEAASTAAAAAVVGNAGEQRTTTKLTPKRASKQHTWSTATERSPVRSASVRKASKLGKLVEDDGKHQEPRRTRIERSASVIPVAPSSSSSSRALRSEKQSSICRLRQSSSKTKIMTGTDPTTSLAKRLSTARLARTSSALSAKQQEHNTNGDLGDLSSLSLCEDDTDNSSHYFAIETRLELKERLVALQEQLDGLLVQTKFAWMKCFADASEPMDSSPLEARDRVVSHDALLAASAIVAKGESFTAKLQLAFTKATSTSNCPIKEYQQLVDSVETEFQDFHTFVNHVARRSFPLSRSAKNKDPEMRSPPHHHSTYQKELNSPNAMAAKAPTRMHPVSFDLPSMQSYCARVAPPYSSYLTKKK